MEDNKRLRDMLMQIDRQFDIDTFEGGARVWSSYFAEDGVMVMSQGEDIKGREAIYNYMSEPFSLKQFSLRWEPIDARTSEDGSLGYTYGKYIRRYLDSSDNEIMSTGKYTSVWQKQQDGSWKVILDIGN